DHIILLYGGKVVDQGSKEELPRSTNPFTPHFIQGAARGPLGMEQGGGPRTAAPPRYGALLLMGLVIALALASFRIVNGLTEYRLGVPPHSAAGPFPGGTGR